MKDDMLNTTLRTDEDNAKVSAILVQPEKREMPV